MKYLIKIIYLTNINNIYYNNYKEHVKIRFIKFWQQNRRRKARKKPMKLTRYVIYVFFHQQIKIVFTKVTINIII